MFSMRAAALACAALLPWKLAYRVISLLATRSRAHPGVHAACAEACAWGIVTDAQRFAQRFTLYRLIDHADLALAWLRGRRWFRKWVQQSGPAFPDRGPYIAITFHYGAGLMALHAMRGHARGVAWVYASPAQRNATRWRAAEVMVRLRIAAVARLGGATPLPTGGAVDTARAWLARGGAIVALMDAPPGGQRKVEAISFCGRRIGLATGLIRLAARAEVPIYLYTAALERDGPGRVLHVEGPLSADDPEAALVRIGDFFDRMVRADPAAWHYWGSAQAAFPPPDPAACEPRRNR